MTAPEQPPLLDALVYALVDGSCELADRGAAKDVWDQTTEDCELLLPVIEAHVAAKVAEAIQALDKRCALALQNSRELWTRRSGSVVAQVGRQSTEKGLELARHYIADALKHVQAQPVVPRPPDEHDRAAAAETVRAIRSGIDPMSGRPDNWTEQRDV